MYNGDKRMWLIWSSSCFGEKYKNTCLWGVIKEYVNFIFMQNYHKSFFTFIVLQRILFCLFIVLASMLLNFLANLRSFKNSLSLATGFSF